MLRIAVHGTGRMALAVDRLAVARDDVTVLALAGPNPPTWDDGAPHVPSLQGLGERPDFLIDFTLPQGTRVAAAWCADNGVALVSGVTGLDEQVRGELQAAAARVPVLWAPNLSLGVNLLADLAERAGAVLDDSVPVAIEDIHHQWKKDAPSGTALMLGERVASGRGGDESEIRYSSVREGEVIGDHTVRFTLDGEEFELIHRAHDRRIYALGAIRAGRWLMHQPPALYSARDWLSAL